MATMEEVLAKADEWEKAGNPENAAKLRAHAETLKPKAPKYDAATVEAKAAEWEKAGKPEEAAKLRAYAGTLPQAKPDAPKPDVNVNDALGLTGKRADTPESEAVRMSAEFAKFEEANPTLKGKYTPDTMPKAGEVVAGLGGGGKSGGARYTVVDWRKPDTFGETAKAMTEGPMAAARAFAGGLGGGDSPAREYLANDPFTGLMPDPLLTALGFVGDAGGAAISTIGAGVSGLAGLAAEAVPGQDAAGEKKLAEDLTGMAMFAAPELAGVSSVPARMAATAPRVAPLAKAAPALDAARAAERIGIPVMRSDIKPPQTFIGKVAQKAGEGIPIAGTGGMRAKQNAARIDAVRNFVSEYVGDTILPAINDVTAAILEKRAADLKRNTSAKTAVVTKLKDAGPVPVTKAIAEIQKQIAALTAQRLDELKPVIAKLEDFGKSLTDQPLDVLEKNRKAVGKAFSDPGLASIRDAGEKALSAVYGPLRDDIAAFVKSKGGPADFTKWKAANEQLASMAGDLRDSALKRVLTKGDETPETVRTMLFSQKPSDVNRLFKSLPESGKASARTAIVQEALAKAGGLENLSPDKFKQALGKLSDQVGVFFRGDDLEAAEGLVKALKLTERAARAGDTPPTGIQNLPILGGMLATDIAGGMGGATALLGGIGGIARIYEATGVRRALRRLAKAQNPAAQKNILQSLEKALKEAGAPAVTGGAQTAEPMRKAN
jgi:hypothetical protein